MLELVSGRYEILEQVGFGGMSVVYKALDRQKNRVVALKVLREEFWKNDEQKRMFMREVKANEALNHKNIVKIYDNGSEGDMLYLVEEFVDGQTLRDVLKAGRISWRSAVKYGLKILAALDHAHGKKIIHRDIKAENIMLDKDGAIKVTDFGIARFLGGGMGTISSDNKIFGSAQYMSPEQVRNADVDERSDLYSLGILLYELLTGRVPFDADNPSVILNMHLNDVPVGIRAYNRDVPPAIEQVVLKALEKEPRMRYPSAVAMADALQKALRSQKGGMFGGFGRTLVKNWRNAILVTMSLVTVLGIVIYGFVRVSDILYGVDVPNVVGKNEQEALSLISASDMRVEESYVYSNWEPEGQVLRQQPEGGGRGRRNKAVSITVSLGAEPVFLPDTVGKDRQSALTLLSEYGFPTVYLNYTSLPGVALDSVVSQSPNDGSAKPGATVNLTINSEQMQVPALCGKTRQQAIDQLEAMGLSWEITSGYSTDAAADTVLLQDPPVGETVLRGSAVRLCVTLPNPVKYLASFNWRVPLKMHVRMVLVAPSGAQTEVFSEDCELDRIIALELESPEEGTHALQVYYDDMLAFTNELEFF